MLKWLRYKLTGKCNCDNLKERKFRIMRRSDDSRSICDSFNVTVTYCPYCGEEYGRVERFRTSFQNVSMPTEMWEKLDKQGWIYD